MNLLFDLDGTLTDPYEGITKCISHALVKLGREQPNREELRWCIGPPLKKSLAMLIETDDDDLAERALTLYRERFSESGIYENGLYEGIPEVLENLKTDGHRLYVATSKPTIYARRIVDYFNIGGYFLKVYGSELDGTRTDKSSLISFILESESIASQDAIMVGDREHDILGARANGVDAIGVLWGYGSREELVDSGATALAEQPKDLVSLINH